MVFMILLGFVFIFCVVGWGRVHFKTNLNILEIFFKMMEELFKNIFKVIFIFGQQKCRGLSSNTIEEES